MAESTEGARRLAAATGFDLDKADISGSGQEGRITKQDVEAVLAQDEGAKPDPKGNVSERDAFMRRMGFDN